jgi:hypothetical protein
MTWYIPICVFAGIALKAFPLQVSAVVQAGALGNTAPCASAQNKLMNRTEPDVSHPRTLIRSPFEHSMPEHALAFAMAMHARLGKCCVFQGLELNLLHIILAYCNEPASMLNFIIKDLQSMFPGLLPSLATDVSLSFDKAAVCVDRLYNFLTFVSNFLEQDPHCSGFAGSTDSAMLVSSSKPFLPALPLDDILSLKPEKHVRGGVPDHYLWVMSEVLETEFVHADRRAGQIKTFTPSMQEWQRKLIAPWPTSKLISSVVSEMLSTSLRDRANGDEFSFPKIAKDLHETLESCNLRSVWLVRGVNVISSRVYGEAFLSIKVDKQLGQVFSRVKDSTQPTPFLSNCMISGIEASKMFQSFCQEDHASFMQLLEVAAHQRQFPQTPEIGHTLLNVAEQLEDRALLLDAGVREVSAAALLVHFFCIMVKQLLEACGSSLDLVDMHSQWLRVNPIPHEVDPFFECCMLICSSFKRSAFRSTVSRVLSGPGYFRVNGHRHPLSLKFEMSQDSSYCFIEAILLELRSWSDEVYKRLELNLCNLESSFDWARFLNSLREWRALAVKLKDEKTSSAFRRHVANMLMDDRNAAACRQFIDVEGLAEVQQDKAVMAVAQGVAQCLNLNFDMDNHVHRLAVAILHPSFQFGIKIIQFLLKLAFGGRFGIATVNRVQQRVAKSQAAEKESTERINGFAYYFCPGDQQTIPTGQGVLVVMAVLRQAADSHTQSKGPGLALAVVRKHVEDQLACTLSDASTGAGSLRMQGTDKGSSTNSLSKEGYERLVQEKTLFEMARQDITSASNFRFTRLSIKGGADGLPLWILKDAVWDAGRGVEPAGGDAMGMDDTFFGNPTDSDAAAAVPVAATGGASVCLHFYPSESGTIG